MGFNLWRAPVPGGWLIATFQLRVCDSVTFVADPDHLWDGTAVERHAEAGALSLADPVDTEK